VCLLALYAPARDALPESLLPEVSARGGQGLRPAPFLYLGPGPERHRGGAPPQVTTFEGSALVGRVRLAERADLLALPGMDTAACPGDADLLLRALLVGGESVLKRLLGDFSFVLWDRARDRLWAAVDALGVRGLFHTRVGGVLALSDTPGALVGLPGFCRQIDELSVGSALVRSGLHGHLP